MSEKYTLYIAENCHDCQQVVDVCAEKGWDYPTINYDKTDATALPHQVYAFPALCAGDQIVAYGIDIIAYLNHKHDQ